MHLQVGQDGRREGTVQHDSIHTGPAGGAAAADGTGKAPGSARQPTAPPGDGDEGAIGSPVPPARIRAS